jgi:hypothetical protein
MLMDCKMSFITAIAAAFATITATIIANYSATLPPPLPPLLALLANPTRAIIALSCLPPLRVLILQTGYTINCA